jgi:tetratricopeptide (TPR) repeat protein
MSDSASERCQAIDVLAEEFVARLRRGERPSLQEYLDKHPDLAGEIRNLFPALVEMEQVKADRSEPVARMADSAPALQQIGDYRPLREVGRGGMGVVYEAEQVSLGRRVALKVLRIGGDGKALERFRREARAAAKLHHTNIVPVYEVGQDGDFCYYAMQFIPGQSLDQIIEEVRRLRAASGRAVGPPSAESTDSPRADDSRPAVDRLAQSLLLDRFPEEAEPVAAVVPESAGLHFSQTENYGPVVAIADDSGPVAPATASSVALPGEMDLSRVPMDGQHYFRSVARIGYQAANALAYAHARKVIHRDVKPSNLLLDTAGVVWITDFGLAKTQDGALTTTGDIVGTLRYMAPERFDGDGDERADVYGLGLTLYELLTLQPAFEARDRVRLIDRIKTDEPPRPRVMDTRIPRDLETIVLKAMQKEAARRYSSAEEMAEDLRRFLADEPIRARRTSGLARLRLWGRRHPALAGVGVTILLMLLVIAVGSTATVFYLMKMLNAVENAEREANQAKDRAEQSYRLARAGLEKVTADVRQDARLKTGEMEDLRKKVLRAQADFYQQFVALRGDDRSFLEERARAWVELGNVTFELGAPEEALGYFQQAASSFEQLTVDYPDDPELRLSLARCLSNEGLQCYYMDRLQPAEAALRRGLQCMAALPAPFAGSAAAQKTLVTLYLDLGLLLHKAKRFPEAEEADDRAIEAGARLVANNPDDAEDLSRLSTLWLNRGYLNEEWGRAEPALDGRQRAVGLAERLNERWPGVDEYRKLLASSYQYLGWTMQWFERPGAEEVYVKALPLRKQLALDHPLRADYQYDWARHQCGLGWLYQKTDRPERAEAPYNEAVIVLAGLVERHPEIPDYQRMLAQTYNDRGLYHYQRTGRFADAEADFFHSLTWRTKLASLDSPSPDDQRDVDYVLEHLAKVYADSDRFVDAQKAYRQAVDGLEKVTKAYPRISSYKQDLADSHRLLGAFLGKTGHPGEALGEFNLALTILEPVSNSRSDSYGREILAACHADRALTLSKYLGRHEDALRDWDRAIQVDGGKTESFRLGRACTLARKGNYAEAAAVVEENGRGPRTRKDLVDVSRVLSLAAAAAITAGQTTLADGYSSKAIATLQEAAAKGFRDAKSLETDADMAPLRSRAEFQKLLKSFATMP